MVRIIQFGTIRTISYSTYCNSLHRDWWRWPHDWACGVLGPFDEKIRRSGLSEWSRAQSRSMCVEICTSLLRLLLQFFAFSLQHTIWEGIHFITSGHGCDKDDPLNQAGFQGLYAADGLQFAQDVGGFGVMEATAKSLSFRFVAESGHTIYSANIVTNGAVELGMPFKYPTFAPTSAILPSVAPTKKPTRKPTRKPTYKPSTKSMHKKKH